MSGTQRRTPVQNSESEYSWLESLPVDLLVEIHHHLRHNQLSDVSRISERIEEAIEIASRSHFNDTTPTRSHVATASEEEHLALRSPSTPPAPNKRGRPPGSRLDLSEQSPVEPFALRSPSTPPAPNKRGRPPGSRLDLSEQYSPVEPFALNRTMSGTQSESWLESLPMELLVEIIGHLHHDQLSDISHVSETTRKAVEIARVSHFNYTTPRRPDRVSTPARAEHYLALRSPITPPAPIKLRRSPGSGN